MGKDVGEELQDQGFRRDRLKGSFIEPSYSGALSFFRRKYTRDLTGADLAITGIPLDLTVSNRPGTRFGPEGIRRASAQHAWGPIWPWRFDPFDTLACVDYGDCAFDWGAPMEIPAAITAHIAGILASGASTLTLGGDHFITYPILRAYAAKYGPLAIVQFDAHRDVEEGGPGRLDHGAMFTYAVNEGLVDPKRSVQVGIRTCFNGEKSHGMTILYADEVHRMSADEVAGVIRDRVGSGPAYLTFDIDCLDPATAPGTGTPVPGGLTSHQALSILRAMKGVDFKGMDVVEVSPPYDHAEMTTNAAAIIAVELLCLKAFARGAKPTAIPI
jgi:agmatinase